MIHQTRQPNIAPVQLYDSDRLNLVLTLILPLESGQNIHGKFSLSKAILYSSKRIGVNNKKYTFNNAYSSKALVVVVDASPIVE